MRFRACTWNVNHGSSGKELDPHVRKFRNLDVDIFLLQEVKQAKNALDPFIRAGYRFRYAKPEFAIAWNPARFEYVRHRKVLMSPTRYWTINYALIVVLKDKKTGKKIKCMSYHPPAHVQRPSHKTWRTVFKALHQIVDKWNRIAKGRRVDACLFGGDDNVDENTGWTPRGGWGFMVDGPLKQIQAPRGTHGARQIDDFRIRGLKLLKKVGVYENPSDHDAFVADFDYLD